MSACTARTTLSNGSPTLGAECRTPEVDTSEVIVDFRWRLVRWMFSGICPDHHAALHVDDNNNNNNSNRNNNNKHRAALHVDDGDPVGTRDQLRHLPVILLLQLLLLLLIIIIIIIMIMVTLGCTCLIYQLIRIGVIIVVAINCNEHD